jgi:predicted permease
MTNLRYALRRLLKDWPFSLGAITILALGIGANTAVFSIMNNTLFKPRPFADPSRLVNIYQNDAKEGEPEGVSYPAFQELQNEAAFAGVAASHLAEGRYQMVDEQGRPGSAKGVLIEYASANNLEVLGLRPSVGRWYTTEEEHSGAPVAVLSWSTWTRDFGSDPEILGRKVVVKGRGMEIVGVGPVTLNSSQSDALITSLWMPLVRSEKRGELSLQVRARLREGVTIERAQAAMNVATARLAGDADPKRGITVLAANDVHIHPREGRLRPVGAFVFAVVGLVLAIACSNLATLLLVRGSARAAEISIRLSLGATRGQLVRLLLTESLLLAAAGAVAGVAIAHAALRYLATTELPVAVSMELDHRVLGFAIAIASCCGIGFGLSPALQVTREVRRFSGGSLSLSRGLFTMKNGLVTAQVAASFLLLAGAALALGILTATQERSVGYRPEGLAIIETDPRYAGYDTARAAALLANIKRRLASLPGVESVTETVGLPGEGQFEKEFDFDGARKGESFRAEGRWAGPGYFQTLAIPVLFGRVFDERDTPETQPAIVVSEALARRFFGQPNATGQVLRFDGAAFMVIGVVGNTRSIDMVMDKPKRSFYRSAAQAGTMQGTIVARVSRNESEMLRALQQEVRSMHPELPIMNAMTMTQRQAIELMPFRIALLSLGVLGGLGLLLAAVGLYAVIAYSVTQRSNELGIRIALGARPGDLTWLVAGDVTLLVAVGLAIGAALAWAGIMALESSVIGVNAWALVRAVSVILGCGAAAAYIPTRRAVRTDPIAAIRRQ